MNTKAKHVAIIFSYITAMNIAIAGSNLAQSDEDRISPATVPVLQSQQNQEKTALPLVEWTVQSDNLIVQSHGISFGDIADFTWKGRVVTDKIRRMIDESEAELIYNSDGFSLRIKNADTELDEPGEFSLMLNNGEEVSIDMLASPILSEKMCAPTVEQKPIVSQRSIVDGRFATKGASNCGSFSDSSNPYPCCSNGSRPDGNCTWYAWYRAHQINRGWGISLPSWGNAKDWAKNAAKSGFKVSSKPKGYKDGYSIGCNTSGSYGHVAWVYDYNDKYVWVDEMNCCDCSVAGFRTGEKAKYKRSYFIYISR